MTFKEIVEHISCEIINKGNDFDTAVIENVSAGDMMSEVLVGDEDNRILVTALTTDQVVRTADIVEARGVILINGKRPQTSMKTLAGVRKNRPGLIGPMAPRLFMLRQKTRTMRR